MPESADAPPPPPIDATVAHNARVWDYWLGGKDHFAVDRQIGDHIRNLLPVIGDIARADRQFLNRAVRYLAGTAGVRQFLDIGTGLPSSDNTHEVAQSVAPDARVVYVDNDPKVLVHARALLTGVDGTVAYLDADVHDPAKILAGASRTLDFGKPVAVMMLGILNFVLDDDTAQSIVDRLMKAAPSGSYLAIAHPTGELGGEKNVEAMKYWNDHATPPLRARTGEEIARLLDGLDVLEPGLVPCSQWRPRPGTARKVVPQYGAVARKP